MALIYFTTNHGPEVGDVWRDPQGLRADVIDKKTRIDGDVAVMVRIDHERYQWWGLHSFAALFTRVP